LLGVLSEYSADMVLQYHYVV